MRRLKEAFSAMKKSTGLAIAKVMRPLVEGVFLRKRLFQMMDALRSRPIVWVSGPPGSGKTTLVSSYLDARKLPHLWYRLDEADGDAPTFFYYMGIAAKRSLPSARKPLPLLTQEYAAGIPTFARRYFEELYGMFPGRFSSSRSSPSSGRSGFAVVFDNYQDVPPGSELHEVIRNCLRAIPEHVNVILISRGVPPPQLARLRANNQMSILGWDELRFGLKETRELVHMKGHRRITDNAIKVLQDSTDGWAAGIILVLEGARKELGGIRPITGVQREEFFDYFSTELFEKVDRETQDFLLKTAFLPEIIVSTAERLTGQRRAGKILAELRRHNFFTTQHTVREGAYQYHRLFREFLLSRAKAALGTEETSALRRSAARELMALGRVEDAAVLLLEDGNWEGLVQLILETAEAMISQGRFGPLKSWIVSLPEDRLKQMPMLLYLLGICYAHFDSERGRVLYEEAFRLFDGKGDRSGSLLAWAGIVETILFERGDFTRLDPWILRLDNLMSDDPSFPSREVETNVVTSMVGAILLRKPNHPGSGVWTERARRLVEADIPEYKRMNLANILHLYYIYTGDHVEASCLIGGLRKTIGALALSPFARMRWRLIEARQSYMVEASGSACLEHIRNGMNIGREEGIHVIDGLFLHVGAFGALTDENYSEFEKMTAEISPLIHRQGYIDQMNYHISLTWRDLCTGDFAAALEHAQIGLRFIEKTGGPIYKIIACLGMAYALFEAGDSANAWAHLKEVRSMAGQISAFKWDFLFLVPEAYFAFVTGKEEEGFDLLRKAMAKGRKQGYLNMFYWRPKVMAFLCVKAFEAGIEVEYVKKLIRTRHLSPDGVYCHFEEWPRPMKIYTLGRFEVFRNDAPFKSGAQTRQRPLSMLKVLIALGGKEVKEAHFTNALWPGADESLSRVSFDTNLHRLRRMLGSDRVITVHDGKVTLNQGDCWVDSYAFEGIVEQVEAGHRTSGNRLIFPDSSAVRLAERAMTLYRGSFLSTDTDESWTLSMREQLRTKFIHLVRMLGGHWKGTGNPEKAVECFRKGIEVDPSVEEFYQDLIQCYHEAGQHAKAIETYHHCRDTFSALGLIPSPETDSLRERVRREAPIV